MEWDIRPRLRCKKCNGNDVCRTYTPNTSRPATAKPRTASPRSHAPAEPYGAPPLPSDLLLLVGLAADRRWAAAAGQHKSAASVRYLDAVKSRNLRTCLVHGANSQFKGGEHKELSINDAHNVTGKAIHIPFAHGFNGIHLYVSTGPFQYVKVKCGAVATLLIRRRRGLLGRISHGNTRPRCKDVGYAAEAPH